MDEKHERAVIETDGQVVLDEKGRKTAFMEFVTEEETPIEG